MVTIYLNGRLGNQMFQYTFARISSIKNGCNFFIPKNVEESINLYSNISRNFSHYFELPTPSNPHYWIGEDIFDIYLGEYDNYVDKLTSEVGIEYVKDGTFLYGFFQTDNYMKSYEDEIKNEWFKFKEPIISKGEEILNKYDLEKSILIHFRGGDYKNINKYFLPKKYYEDAIEYFGGDEKNVIIITDDIECAKTFFPFSEIINNEIGVDLYLLTKFKKIIIPNSSFSWWGAWLNKNNPCIIAPKYWFNYNDNNGIYDPPNIKTNKFIYL